MPGRQLYIILVLSLYGGLAFASQMANVIADKAIIYADVEMSAPIGFISKGKEVKIGDVARNKGKLLPVVVSGKIAYIKRTDIETRFDRRLRTRQEIILSRKHENEHVDELEMDMTLGAGLISSSTAVVGDKTKAISQYGVTIRGARIYPMRRRSYRVGLEYGKGTTSNDESLATMALTSDLGYLLGSLSVFQVDAFIGGRIFPWAQYEYSSYFKVNGNGYGAYFGLHASAELTKKWSAHLEWRYDYNQFLGFNIPSTEISKFEPVVQSSVIYAGVGQRF